MPRQARLDMPGALHHIMIRGMNKSDIFVDDKIGQNFWSEWVRMCKMQNVLYMTGL